MSDIFDELKISFLKGPVFVHSDLRHLLEALNIDFRQAILESNSLDHLIESYINLLQSSVGGRDLWIPTYNYDFCKTHQFDIENDVSQVGSISEYYRRNKAEWRTCTPVFSICGSGQAPTMQNSYQIDPFGKGSEFDQLYQHDGSILFFGVDFSPTFTHYVERISGDGPLYRYDKLFPGEVTSNIGTTLVELKYHVTPLGYQIKYDMQRLFSGLIKQGIMRKLPERYPNSYIVSVKELTSYWQACLLKDPFFLLDKLSKQVFEHLVMEKGGRLEIQDFEGPINK